jgi:hypothetical protein
MSLEKYSNRFCKLTNTDLLVIYTRVNGQHALFDERDAIVISTLIESHKKQSLREKLTILIHSQGGDMVQSIKISTIVQGLYKSIDTVVLNIAKSCMSLASLTGQNFYLNVDAGISDFSINTNEKLNFDEFNKINVAAIKILHKGVLSTEQQNGNGNAFKDVVTNLIMASSPHGTTITYPEIKKILPHAVRPTTEYSAEIFHLSSIHSLLINEFNEKQGLYKVLGFNGVFTKV